MFVYANRSLDLTQEVIKVPLNLEDKKAIVAEVSDIASNALSAVAAEYRGLTVAHMNQLRSRARNSGVYLRVIRNTLARKAIENTEFDCMKSVLTGPLIIAFCHNEPGAAARLFRDFAKENEKFIIKALAIGGKLLEAKDINIVAELPTRDQAISQLMSVFKAPITKFVRTLAEPHAKLVRTIAAIRDKKTSC